MTTSVGTKARKKQSPKHDSNNSIPLENPAFERALIALEGVCVRILEDRLYSVEADMDRLSWLQRVKNIVTPVSLALAESRGPRKFHFHYRHNPKDDSQMQPVLEPVVDMLARTCEYALKQCETKLVGIHDRDLVQRQRMLESALRVFLASCRRFA